MPPGRPWRASWGPLEGSVESLGSFLGGHGGLLGALGVALGPSWAVFAASWALCGRFFASLGGSWGPSGGHLGAIYRFSMDFGSKINIPNHPQITKIRFQIAFRRPCTVLHRFATISGYFWMIFPRQSRIKKLRRSNAEVSLRQNRKPLNLSILPRKNR